MNLFHWIDKHTYPVHTAAFALMILASVMMYLAAEAGAPTLIWIGMTVFIIANLLALAAR